MKIGLDVTDERNLLQSTILGAIEAYKALPESTRIVLIGDKEIILPYLFDLQVSPEHFEFLPIRKAQHIAMKDNGITSIELGQNLFKNGIIDAFASANIDLEELKNTKEFVADAYGTPALSILIPQIQGGHALLVDIGLNPNCTAGELLRFAQLGTAFAKEILDISDPKVGLMNIGEEEEKGNMLTQNAHMLIRQNGSLNFIGNIEGRDLFNNRADVIVCDGFTGNILLKLTESFYNLTTKKGFIDDFFECLNFEAQAFMTVLGSTFPIIISDRIANPASIKNMLMNCQKVLERKLDC